jgi:G:T-mismatch repair DNA endonuclease (very short patch repair protein)
LRELGWQVVTVWECEVKREEESLPKRLDALLLGAAGHATVVGTARKLPG